MNYKVTISSNSYSVKQSSTPRYKVSVILGESVANLSDLKDVQLSGNNYDKYVLIYDASTGKWKDMNPDVVLSAATTTPDANRTTFTLPTDFEDKLDTDLSDKIDLDAGTF